MSFSLRRGEMVALIGAAGAGKSTLIRTIAGLVPIDKDARGQRAGASAITLFGEPMQRNDRVARSAKALRARVGVIFQQFNLMPRLSVHTNVCLGSLGRVSFIRGALGCLSAADQRRAVHALARVGMAEHALKRGSELSGGQQQRAEMFRVSALFER